MKVICNSVSDLAFSEKACEIVLQHACQDRQLPNSETYQVDFTDGKLVRLHGGGRADVYFLEYKNRICCAKYFHDRRFFSIIKNILGSGRAFQAYQNGIKLEELNIDAPRVISVVMKNPIVPPVLLMEMVEGYQQINLVIEQWKNAAIDLTNDERFNKLANNFSDFTGNLISGGVSHNDFSPRNVLMRETNTGFEFFLIDFEDVVFSKNSQQMVAHFEERLRRYVNAAEYLHFMNIFNTRLGSKNTSQNTRE